MKPWTIATALVAAALFAIAIDRAAYEITSPPWLGFHVLLRKTYSIVAFALVGYGVRRSLAEWGRSRWITAACIAGVAAYSGLIEIAQYFAGSHEGLRWNIFDVGCGAVGGAFAVADRLVARRPASRTGRS